MTNTISVHTTFANLDEAKKIAKFLAKEKLIACANLLPCQSVYLWKGDIEEAEEVVAIFKTIEEKYERLEKEIKSQSSYESPAIFVTKIDDESPETSDWLFKVLREGGGHGNA